MAEVPSFEWQDQAPSLWVRAGYGVVSLILLGLFAGMGWVMATSKERWTFFLLLIPLAVVPVAVLYLVPPWLWKGRAIKIDYERGVVEFRRPFVVGFPNLFAIPAVRTYQFSELRFVNIEPGSDMLTMDIEVPRAQLRFIARVTEELRECRQRLKEICGEQAGAEQRQLRGSKRLARAELLTCLVFFGMPIVLACVWGVVRLVLSIKHLRP